MPAATERQRGQWGGPTRKVNYIAGCGVLLPTALGWFVYSRRQVGTRRGDLRAD